VGAMAIADLVKSTLGPKGMVRVGLRMRTTADPVTQHKAGLAVWRSTSSRVELPQDKILQSMGRGKGIMVTNDGATILKSIYVDNAAAKVLVGEL